MARWRDRLLLFVAVLAPLALGLEALFSMVPSLFLLLGLVSLVSIYLPERAHYWVIPLIYVPALFSLYMLVAERQPGPLIELASGYLLSIPFLAVLAMARSTAPRPMITNYVSALAAALMLWLLVHQAAASRTELFLVLINMIIGRGIGGGENVPQAYAVIAAVSTLALLLLLYRYQSEGVSQEFARPFIYALSAASLATGLLVTYSLFFADSSALALLVSAFLTISLVVYLGVSERWRG